MKKFLVTLGLALAAFVVGFIGVMGVIYVAWWVRSRGYNHSPPLSPSDPHDAAGMMLLSMELLFGLPVGALVGLFASVAVGMWRWRTGEPTGEI